MMKYAVASALVLGLAALSAQAFAGERRYVKCADCPPAKKYDSQEVVKTSRTIDRSRVINTTTVVPVSRRLRKTNHLIVHERETRNVGVVRHNHTMIDKEIRTVRPVAIVVNELVQDYRVVPRPALYRPVYPVHRQVPSCRYGALNRYGSCHRVLRSRG